MRNDRLTRYVLQKNLIAAVLGMAVSSLNMSIDAFLMANLLGPQGLSAVNLCAPLSYGLTSLQCLLASGASLQICKRLGERDRKRADQIFTVSILSLFAAGLCLMLLSGTITEPIVSFLCRREELTGLVRPYCHMLIGCSMPIMFQIALSTFAQRAGSPKAVVNANLASLLVNLLMDIVYVKVLGLGIGGAALATGTGSLAACVVTLLYLVKHKPLRLVWPGPKALAILAKNMGTSLAGTLQNISISLLTLVLNVFIQRTQGTDGMFVLSIGMIFLTLALFFAMGVQNIFTSLGSMMHGQEDNTGLRMLLKNAVRLAIPVTILLVLIQLLFPVQLAQLFGATTPEQLSMASRGLRIMSLYSVPLCLLLLLIADYQVLGFYTLASVGSGGMLAFLPLCLWLCERTLPADWIWVAMPLSGALTIVMLLVGSSFFQHKEKGERSFYTLLPTDPGEKKIYEATVELRQGDIKGLIGVTEQTVPFFESLGLDRRHSIRIRLCLEEMLDSIIRCSGLKQEVSDVRIVASPDKVNILIQDNLPPCNPLAGEDQVLNRKIVEAFCPNLSYRYSFVQNIHILEWKWKK